MVATTRQTWSGSCAPSSMMMRTWCSGFGVESEATWARSCRTPGSATGSCWVWCPCSLANPSADLPPFRAVRFSSLLDLEMDDRNWGWTLQMQIRAERASLRVAGDRGRTPAPDRGAFEDLGITRDVVRVGAKMFYTLGRERSALASGSRPERSRAPRSSRRASPPAGRARTARERRGEQSGRSCGQTFSDPAGYHALPVPPDQESSVRPPLRSSPRPVDVVWQDPSAGGHGWRSPLSVVVRACAYALTISSVTMSGRDDRSEDGADETPRPDRADEQPSQAGRSDMRTNGGRGCRYAGDEISTSRSRTWVFLAQSSSAARSAIPPPSE